MSRCGFYLMARGWMDHPALSTAEPFTRREAWIWLIENAAFRDTRIDVHGKTVPVRRGQVCRSYRDLAATWGWSLGVVQRFIARLETDTLVSTRSDTGRLLITLCNYERYQAPFSDADTAGNTAGDTPAIHARYSGGTQKKEGKEDTTGELRSPAASAAVEAEPEAPFPEARPTPGQALFREGLQKMRQMTRRTEDSVRRWIVTLRQKGVDDALVLEAIQDAHRRWLTPGEERAHAISWITAYIKARMPDERPVPEEANGWIVSTIVERCYDLIGAEGEVFWPGFALAVADALAAGADPDRHIYPAMRAARQFLRGDTGKIRHVSWFKAAIEGQMGRRDAA